MEITKLLGKVIDITNEKVELLVMVNPNATTNPSAIDFEARVFDKKPLEGTTLVLNNIVEITIETGRGILRFLFKDAKPTDVEYYLETHKAVMDDLTKSFEAIGDTAFLRGE